MKNVNSQFWPLFRVRGELGDEKDFLRGFEVSSESEIFRPNPQEYIRRKFKDGQESESSDQKVFHGLNSTDHHDDDHD